MNIYEIYTKNPETGESGWDIKWVMAENRQQVSMFPFFDCVITVNDYWGRTDVYNVAGEIVKSITV